MTHALKILSIKKEHTYVRLNCKYRHHTVYMNHSHQIVKYIQLKLDVQKSLWSLWLAVISLYTYVRSTIHYPPIKFKKHTYYNFSHVILLKENKGYFCKTKWWSMVIHTNRLCSFSSFFCLHLPIQNSATGRGTCLFWIEAPTNNFWGLSLIFSN